MFNIIIALCVNTPFACGSGGQFLAYFLLIAVDDYLTSCLAISTILIEIFVDLQRFFLITKKSFSEMLDRNMRCQF